MSTNKDTGQEAKMPKKDATSKSTIENNGKEKAGEPKTRRIKNKFYEQELAALQSELVKLQEWVKHEGLKVVVIFEGRDAAGK